MGESSSGSNSGMSTGKIGCLVVAVIVFILGLSMVSVYNSLNSKYQSALGGKSTYSSALNVCSQKIEGVWTVYSQYLDHESQTFQHVTEARSGFQKAYDDFVAAKKAGSNTKDLTEQGNKAYNAALAFNVQIEAYPNLKAADVAQSNITNMQESLNEIKTALDDWISTIKDYNTYRGSAWPSLVGSWFGRFPAELQYYDGPIKELNITDLNPRNKNK